ncbi:MAG: sigma-70 family RNA polymerase sigma factor [Nannocystaceae bacterium]|nr:sigma-70 family RNA polymerase sigma factor [Nannocystaceae bacterium]
MAAAKTETTYAPSAQLDALVRAHAPMVRRALRQLGVGPHQLDDAAQDVFVVLVRRIADFDGARSLTNWLWGIARGVASGYRRSTRRRTRLHTALVASPVPAETRGVERAVAGSQAARIVKSFLDALDDGKCAVFVLAEIEGRSGPEIAERLGLNLNTVYARLRAARRAFTAAVAGHHDSRARPLFAGLVPSLGKPLSLVGAAAVATVMALPIASAPDTSEAMSRLAGYHMIPDAVASDSVAEFAVDLTPEPGRRLSRSRPHGSAVSGSAVSGWDGGAASITAALDFPFGDTPFSGTELGDGGQSMVRGRTNNVRAEREQPMLTTIALAAFIAGPNPTTTNQTETHADADTAARVGTQGATVVYEFFDETLEGDVLRDDGSMILHRPSSRYESLLKIRGHFVPELIRLATDV